MHIFYAVGPGKGKPNLMPESRKALIYGAVVGGGYAFLQRPGSRLPFMKPRYLGTGLGLAAGLAAALMLLAGPGRAESQVVTLTKEDCRRLNVHVPDPGVAYRPGVDARGRPVAPADLGGTPALSLPETVTIEIEVDLQERFGIPADPGLFKGDAQLGTVTVDRDGRARFNGQPLQDEAQYELARRCQEILSGRPEAAQKP